MDQTREIFLEIVIKVFTKSTNITRISINIRAGNLVSVVD